MREAGATGGFPVPGELPGDKVCQEKEDAKAGHCFASNF
jgi:hypothetical protein